MGENYKKLSRKYQRLIDAILTAEHQESRYAIMVKAGFRARAGSKHPRRALEFQWYRLHKDPVFLAAMEERREEIYQEERIKVVCDLERLILEEQRIAYANLIDLLDDDGYLRCAPTQLTEDQQRAIQALDIEEIRDPETGDVVLRRIRPKLWDKSRALERLGKLLGAYPGGRQHPQVVEQPSVEAATERVMDDVRTVLSVIFGRVSDGGQRRRLPGEECPAGNAAAADMPVQQEGGQAAGGSGPAADGSGGGSQ